MPAVKKSLVEEALGSRWHRERRLILSIGHGNGPAATADVDGLDWGYVIQTSYEHRLIPHLHHAIQAREDVPDDVASRLQKLVSILGLTVESHVRQLKSILDEFERANIRVLAFKGPPLAQIAYGDVARRQPGDLDLLVDRETFAEASEMLLGRGYVADRERIGEALDRKIGLSFKHRRGSVDLHWSLDDYPFTLKIGTDQIWDKSAYVDLEGVRVRTLGLEHLPHYLCFHASKHIWARLVWVADLSQLIVSRATEIDWGRRLQEAVEWRTAREVRVGLLLASDLMGAAVPDPIRSQIEGDATSMRLGRIAARQVFERSVPITRHLYRLGAFEKMDEKVRYLIHRATRTWSSDRDTD